MSEHWDQFDELLAKYVELMKQFHATTADTTKFRNSKDIFVRNFKNLPPKLFRPKQIQSLINIVNAIPDDDKLIHNDFHPQNIIRNEDGGLMIIDMADVSYGHCIFDLGSIYTTLVFAGSASNKICKSITGLSSRQAKQLWNETIRKYLGTDDKKTIKKFEKKCAIMRNLSLSMLIATESTVWSPFVLFLGSLLAKLTLIAKEKKCIRELSSLSEFNTSDRKNL